MSKEFNKSIFTAITGTEYNPETDKTTEIEINGLVIRGLVSDMHDFFKSLEVAFIAAGRYASATGRGELAAKFKEGETTAGGIANRL